MFKKINFWLSSFLPQKLYWHLAGLIHPWEAVIEGVDKPELLYQQGENVVALLMKLKLINKKTSILDIGCGVGRVEYAVGKYVKSCVGIDIAPSMIKLAKTYVKAPNVEFLVTDGVGLRAVKNQKFDLVFCIIVFQHLPRKIFLNYLKEITTILKKSGKVFFQIPIYSGQRPQEPPQNHPWGLRFYQLSELEEILKKLKYSQIRFFNTAGDRLLGQADQAFVLAVNK